MTDWLSAAPPIAAAALGGLAVGIERQWSGHAEAHFAGVRTFTLLGGCAGLAGWLWQRGYDVPATVLLAGAVLLVIAAYVAASRRDIDGTSEMAALLVCGAGFVSGLGGLALASAIIAVTLLMLVEKTRLHDWVRRLNDAELRAGARFAVLAMVVLPLLPEGPFGPFDAVRPRRLWMLVLLFAGLSFVGYIARRAVGARRGATLAGLLGGLVSSTQVTLAHARASRETPRLAAALASGALAASTVLFLRTLVAALVLAPPLALALLPLCALPFVAGVLATAASARQASAAGPAGESGPGNPLQLRGALQMALLFQLVLVLVYAAREYFGSAGLLVSAALVGLTDVDAVTVSMVRMLRDGMPAAAAAQAVAIGILSNTLLKLALACLLGAGRFRLVTGAGLAAICTALAVALLVA